MFEGFLEADELAAAQEALWLHYPRPEEYFADPAAHAWLATDQWAGIVGGPWRSWSLNRLAFHPDLLDLAERFLGSADLRLYEAELWAKYAGAVDYDQRHHRDFVNHSLVVPKRSQPATQMLSWILLSDVGDEDGPTKVVPLSVGESVPYWPVPGHHDITNHLPAGMFAEEEVSMTGPAGTLFAFRTDVLHRGSRMTGERSSPLRAPRRLRRVGTALDRQSRLGRARDGSGLVRDRRAGVSPGAVGVRLPRSGRPVLGRADPGRHPDALPRGRSDAVPLSGPAHPDRRGLWSVRSADLSAAEVSASGHASSAHRPWRRSREPSAQPDRQVIAGGLTRAQRGPPCSSVSEIDADEWRRTGSRRPAAGIESLIMSLARRNMAKDPSAPTSPHVRYRNRSPFLPWTAGPRRSTTPSRRRAGPRPPSERCRRRRGRRRSGACPPGSRRARYCSGTASETNWTPGRSCPSMTIRIQVPVWRLAGSTITHRPAADG